MKKKKPIKDNFKYTGVKNPWTHRNEILHDGRAPWRSYQCKVRWWSVRPFSCGGGRGVEFQVFPLTLVVVLTTLWHIFVWWGVEFQVFPLTLVVVLTTLCSQMHMPLVNCPEISSSFSRTALSHTHSPRHCLISKAGNITVHIIIQIKQPQH